MIVLLDATSIFRCVSFLLMSLPNALRDDCSAGCLGRIILHVSSFLVFGPWYLLQGALASHFVICVLFLPYVFACLARFDW